MANITGRKFGGRKKGTQNKVTQKLRLSIIDFLDDNFDEVVKIWQKLDNNEKVKFYRDLLQYAVPRLRNTGLDINEQKVTVLELPKNLDLSKPPDPKDFYNEN